MAFNAYPALSIQQPDIAGTMLAAEQIKSSRERNALAKQLREQEEEAQDLRRQILLGDGGQGQAGAPAAAPGQQNAMLSLPGAPGAPGGAGETRAYQPGEAMRRLAVIDPKGYNEIQTALTNMDERERAERERQAEISGRLALTVLGAPEADRPLYYRAGLKAAQENGLDISRLPPEYSPEAEQALKISVGMAQAVKEMIAAQKPPEGWMQTPEGGLAPRPGGPADPAYLRTKTAATQSPDRTLVEVYDPDSPTGTRYVPRAEAINRPGKPSKSTQRDTDIQALLERGFTQTEAEDIAAGRVKASQPDQFGDIWLTNTATGERRKAGEAAQPGAAPPQAGQVSQAQIAPATEQAPQRSMEELAYGGSGPWSNLMATATMVGEGLLGFDEVFPDNANTRSELRLFERTALDALVNNPRFPVAEQNFVRRMIPSPDTFWTSKQQSVRDTLALRNWLEDRKAANAASMQGTLTQDERGRLTDQNAAIDRVLSAMGPRPAGLTQSDPARPVTDADFEALPPGAYYIDPDDGGLYRKTAPGQ